MFIVVTEPCGCPPGDTHTNPDCPAVRFAQDLQNMVDLLARQFEEEMKRGAAEQ